MNIYVTGGHLTPALAVIEVLKRRSGDHHIFFVGRLLSSEFPRVASHEQKEVEEQGVPFYGIQAAKIHREHFWLNLFEILKFPVSFFQVTQLFFNHKPDVILSFGGYVAFPVCLVGKLFGSRVVTHEQTKAAGLANQVISKIADVVAVSGEESLKYFPKNKTVVVGNPIRESLLKEYKTPPTWLPAGAANSDFIYVTGGSQGSQIINHTISVILPKLLKNFVIIHQCGTSNDHINLRELEEKRDSLPTEFKTKYFVREWIDAKEVSYLMGHAKFVIGRSGANTVQELMHSGTPAIFIPLAFAYQNEQEKNAREMVDAGAASIILQKDLFPETLYQAVLRTNRRFDKMKQKALKLKSEFIKDGAQRLAQIVTKKTSI